MAGSRSKRKSNAPKANDDPAAQDRAAQTRWFTHPDPIVRLTAWVALFTLCAVIVAALQWCTLQETNKISLNANRRHMLLSELEVSGIKQLPAGPQQVVLSTYFKFGNYGNAPAKVYKWCAALHAGALPTVPQYRPCNRALRVIAPNKAFDSAKPFTKMVDQPTAARILNGEIGLFFFGILDYGDAIDTPHRSRFCYQLDFAGVIEASGSMFPAHPLIGNTTDKNASSSGLPCSVPPSL
jgi:hypothetical protein